MSPDKDYAKMPECSLDDAIRRGEESFTVNGVNYTMHEWNDAVLGNIRAGRSPLYEIASHGVRE